MSMRRVIPIFILILMTAYGPLSMIDDFEDHQVNFAGETAANTHDAVSYTHLTLPTKA